MYLRTSEREMEERKKQGRFRRIQKKLYSAPPHRLSRDNGARDIFLHSLVTHPEHVSCGPTRATMFHASQGTAKQEKEDRPWMKVRSRVKVARRTWGWMRREEMKGDEMRWSGDGDGPV